MADLNAEPQAGLPPTAILSIGALIFLYLFVLQPLVAWASENPLLFAAMAGMTFFVLLSMAVIFLMAKARESARLGGAISSHSSGYSSGRENSASSALSEATRKPSGKWRPRIIFSSDFALPQPALKTPPAKTDDPGSQINLLEAVAQTVHSFSPADADMDEEEYRISLLDFLCRKFPNQSALMHSSNAKPSLSVGNVAIELVLHSDKNPSSHFLGKCPGYAAKYPDIVLVVLEPRFSQEKYEQDLKPLDKSFRAMAVILK